MEKIHLPSNRDRLIIIGPTGSGKTHAALWHLSNASFTSRPWIVINPKREELIEAINCYEMDVADDVPKWPGIYDVQPLPSDAELVDNLLTRIWDNEKVGIWMDEGLMFGTGDGLDACLTQGRSKQVPMIMLMQRPIWVSRFAISEASFINYFGLRDKRDQLLIKSFSNIPTDQKLEKYHSYYYDVSRNQNFLLKPVPKKQIIVDKINRKLDDIYPQRKVI